MFSYLYNAIYNTFFENVNQIIPRLYLGNYKAALDYNFIVDNKIDIIVNCTPNIPFIELPCQSNVNLEFIRIPVEDSLLEKDLLLMEHYFKILIPYLHTCYKENKTILIHCYAGKQRSGIVVAALLKLLLDSKSITLDDNYLNQSYYTNSKKAQFYNIINYILSKRPQAFTYGWRINFKKTYQRFFY